MSDRALVVVVGIMLLLLGASAYLFLDKGGESARQFQQECERLGGQVIQARQPYLACVPKVEGFHEPE